MEKLFCEDIRLQRADKIMLTAIVVVATVSLVSRFGYGLGLTRAILGAAGNLSRMILSNRFTKGSYRSTCWRFRSRSVRWSNVESKRTPSGVRYSTTPTSVSVWDWSMAKTDQIRHVGNTRGGAPF